MAVEFIPNQPVIFEADDQPCKNADTRQYNILLQSEDHLHVQVKNNPCGSEELCQPLDSGTECLANTQFNSPASEWDFGGDWTLGTNQIIVNTTSSAPLTQFSGDMVNPTHLGYPYVVRVTVTDYVTGILNVFVGETLAGKISSNGTHTFFVHPTLIGDFVLRNDHDTSAGYLPLHLTVTEASLAVTLQCVNNWDSLYRSIQLVTNESFTGSANGWTLGAGWTYGSSKITHTPGTASIAYQNIPSVEHRKGYSIQVSVLDRTAGTLTVDFGNATLMTFTGNGITTVQYSLPTTIDGTYGKTQFSLIADSAFDGSVTYALIDYNQQIVSLTENGLCKTDDTVDATIEWQMVTNFDPSVIFKETIALRSYTSGYVRSNASTFVTYSEGHLFNSNGDFNKFWNFDPSSSSKYYMYFSTDFIGCIQSWSLKMIFTSHAFIITDVEDNPVSDQYYYGSSQDAPVFHDDFVSWSVDFSDVLYGGDPISLQSGCYKIRFYDGCADDYKYQDGVISYSSIDIPCTRMVSATCDNQALGFDFSQGFKIQHRLRVLRISPKYRIKGDEYVYSSGRNNLNAADTDKVWICWFDYTDENTHDTIAVQMLCDTISIDGVPYYAVPQDYEPEWATNMRRNLAQSRIELKKKTSKLYKRNCQ